MVRSSSQKLTNKFLRKHRKWPLSPYKTKWHQTFSQQQAMQTLKQATSTPPQQQHHQENLKQPNILTSLLHSFSLYSTNPTPNAYLFAIKTLTNTSQFHNINPILNHLQHVEKFQTPEYIFTHLIKTYGDANKTQDAINVFYRIPKFRCVPTVYSLNTLLSVLCSRNNNECLKMVPQVLLQSQQLNIRLEESTFSVLITTLCRIKRVDYAIEILHCMRNDGYSVDMKMCCLILKSLCEQKNLATFEVMGFLEGLRKLGFCPGMGDYSNVIRLFVKSGRGMDALDVLNMMKVNGIKPDIVCYTMVLSGVVENNDFVKAEEVFDELLVLGLVPDVYTYNVYIHGLCKQNNVEDGIMMVKSMEELGCKPNVVTYNTLLEGFCKGGEISRAREIIREMEMRGIGLNLQTYKIMIDGLVSKGEIIEASGLLEGVVGKRFCLRSLNVDEVICGLCHRGMVCEALELIQKMADENVFAGVRVWEALLLSCGSNLSFAETILIDLAKPN